MVVSALDTTLEGLLLAVPLSGNEKCWAHSLLRAVLHCHSPGVATATTVARRLRINVHDDDDDDDDNA